MKQLIGVVVLITLASSQSFIISPRQFDQFVSVGSEDQIQQAINNIISSNLPCDQKYFSVFCLLAKMDDSDVDFIESPQTNNIEDMESLSAIFNEGSN